MDRHRARPGRGRSLKLTEPAPRWLIYPLLAVVFIAGGAAGHYLFDPPEPETRFELVQLAAKQVQEKKAVEKKKFTKKITEPSGKTTEETGEWEVTKTDTQTNETSSTALVQTSRPVQKSWSLGAIVAATWKEPTPAPSAFSVGAIGDLRLGKTPCFAGGIALLELRAGVVTQGSLGVTGRCEF